jgi:beta-fructofuranosidase
VGRAFDLTARLEPTGDAGLRLLTAPDGSEYLDLRLDTEAGELVVDRDHASLDTRAYGGSYRMPCPTGRPVDLRVVVDHSIAEVFLTTTGQALTLRFYPTGQGPWRLQARTAPGTCLGYAVDAWELHPLVIKEPSAGATEPAPTSL